MQNKDKGDGIEDSPLDMLLVILLDGASKEVVMPSSVIIYILASYTDGFYGYYSTRPARRGTLVPQPLLV